MDIEFVVSPGKIDPEKERIENSKDFIYNSNNSIDYEQN